MQASTFSRMQVCSHTAPITYIVTCAAGGSCSVVRRAAACCDSAAITAASTPSSCSCLAPRSMPTRSAAVGCGLQRIKQQMPMSCAVMCYIYHSSFRLACAGGTTML